MGFTTEEIGVIDGIVCAQMLPRSGTGAIQDRYWNIHRHLHENQIDHVDLTGIRDMLLFLLPVFDGERQVQKDMLNALMKTDILLSKHATM